MFIYFYALLAQWIGVCVYAQCCMCACMFEPDTLRTRAGSNQWERERWGVCVEKARKERKKRSGDWASMFAHTHICLCVPGSAKSVCVCVYLCGCTNTYHINICIVNLTQRNPACASKRLMETVCVCVAVELKNMPSEPQRIAFALQGWSP